MGRKFIISGSSITPEPFDVTYWGLYDTVCRNCSIGGFKWIDCYEVINGVEQDETQWRLFDRKGNIHMCYGSDKKFLPTYFTTKKRELPDITGAFRDKDGNPVVPKPRIKTFSDKRIVVLTWEISRISTQIHLYNDNYLRVKNSNISCVAPLEEFTFYNNALVKNGFILFLEEQEINCLFDVSELSIVKRRDEKLRDHPDFD